MTVAQLIYPGDRYADRAARDLALAVLQQTVFGSGPGGEGWTADAFLERLGAADGGAWGPVDQGQALGSQRWVIGC